MLPSARQDLERSGISLEQADTCQLFDVANAREIYPDFRAEPALVIPYLHPNGEPMTFLRDGVEQPFCRVRYVDPPAAPRGFTGKTKTPKYGQPGASGTHVYFPPSVPWETILPDVQIPLILCEGEKKGIAGCAAGFNVIALGGVFNYAESGSNDLLPELESIPWRNRRLYVTFDSDALLNGNIQTAEARLVQELGIKRGAQVHIVRLPQDGEEKVGLDDFLLAYGPEAFEALLDKTAALGRLDSMVVALNKSVAWIEQEGCLFNQETHDFISKENFITGSKFSTLKYITVGGKNRKPTEVSVAKTFLTHPHAQRYEACVFRPGDGPVVEDEKGFPALNSFHGWRAEHGVTGDDKRIAAFLELSRFLFKNMESGDRDLPLKLLAYKAQHPQEKIDKALVLIGPQGCGKTLFFECVAAAFGPYSKNLKSNSFNAEFQGWMEQTVFAVINEAEAAHVRQYGEALKALISDLKVEMNVKFRPERTVNSYTMYGMTANNRAVGAYSADDRRMIVVGCPNKMTTDAGRELYTYLGLRDGDWHRTGGPAALMGYLLELDLGDWKPPFDPPMTGEKYNSYRENLSVVQDLADKMTTAKGEGVIRLWLDASLGWARQNELSNNTALAGQARAALDGMKHFPIRPFYEATELTLLFPNLVNTILHSKYDQTSPPGLISRELRNNGVPFLRCADDPRGFMWKGELRQYLILVDRDEWDPPLTQAEFERVMREFPIYGRK